MMRRANLALLACLVVAAGAQGGELYRFGRLGDRLSAEDVAAIEATVRELGEPFALGGWYSQVLPEVRYVDAFMPPTVSHTALRRGPVVHLQCSPIGDQPACLVWKRRGPIDFYAQVADSSGAFAEALAVRSLLERPIRVHGEVSDEELVSLVEYIRTSPRPRPKDGWYSPGLDGSIPISDIHRNADGSIRVLLTADGYSFQGATCFREERGWQVTDVGYGVA